MNKYLLFVFPVFCRFPLLPLPVQRPRKTNQSNPYSIDKIPNRTTGVFLPPMLLFIRNKPLFSYGFIYFP